MIRDALAATRPARDLVARLRRILFRGTVVGLGALSPAVATATPMESNLVLQPVPTTSIVDRQKKAPKLILQLPGRFGAFVAQHRSHASHASHASHVSGAGGSVAAPRPAPAPAPPSAPSTPTTAAAVAVPLAALATEVPVVKFKSYDARTKKLLVKDASGLTREFLLRDDTTLIIQGNNNRLDEYLETHRNALPFQLDAELHVRSKPSPTGNGQIGVAVW